MLSVVAGYGVVLADPYSISGAEIHLTQHGEVCFLLSVVQTLPWNNLKFADESHIVSNKLTNGRVLGMVNRRTWTPQHTLHAAHATLTILTCIDNIHSPIRCDYSPEVGNQWTFVDFVLDCCITNALVQGDYLIVYNAAIHCAADSRESY